MNFRKPKSDGAGRRFSNALETKASAKQRQVFARAVLDNWSQGAD